MSDRHYEFTEEKTEHFGHILHRIKAIIDLPQHNVKAGDLGGFVESYDNLSDSAWVDKYAKVFDHAKVCGNARIFEHAEVYDKACVWKC